MSGLLVGSSSDLHELDFDASIQRQPYMPAVMRRPSSLLCMPHILSLSWLEYFAKTHLFDVMLVSLQTCMRWLKKDGNASATLIRTLKGNMHI